MNEKSEFHLTDYECNICNKFYSSKSSLCNHNKKFHNGDVSRSIPQMKIDISKSTPIICNYCNKYFSTPQNKWKHQNRVCKSKINLLEENEKLKEENEKLKKTNQIIPLNLASQLIPLNNTSQINNGTINNTINNTHNNLIINQIGNEKIDLDSKDIKCIARDGLNGAITCVRKTNFNRKKPENHSFYASSLEGQYCTTINYKTQKPEKISKKELINKVLESSFKIIEGIAIQIEFNKELRDTISVEEQERLQFILDNKYKFYEKKNWRTFYNSINSMSYNYKDLIISTWSLLKNRTTEEILESSDNEFDSDSEPDIKEVTSFSDSSDDESDLKI